jgi:hypothetical protein
VAGAKGKRKFFEALSLGIDTRTFQSEGRASDAVGVGFTLEGDLGKVYGIQPFVAAWDTSPSPMNTDPIVGIGIFNHHGVTDILLNYAGTISVLRHDGVDTNQYAQVTGRFSASRPRDAHRFVQSGDVMVITNGYDQNLKWDGIKFSPLGIAAVPPPPSIATDADGKLWTGGDREGEFWEGRFIEGNIDSNTQYRYKMTWLNDKGQESEPSNESNVAIDGSEDDVDADPAVSHHLVLVTELAAEAPSVDIVGRVLYRSTDGGLVWYFNHFLPGTSTDTLWDYITPGTEAGDVLPDGGTNSPPPVSKWAFPFRTRTYYGGDSANPTLLYYSRENGMKESVSAANFIDTGGSDGEALTGWALSRDFALIFRQRSVFMLTHDKSELPILTPVYRGAGAVSDTAIASFDGKVYFMSEDGIFVTDGSETTRLSAELDQRVRRIPKAFLVDTVAWVDPRNRMVCFSICPGPSDSNKEVWAIYTESGAFTRLENFDIYSAARFRGETLVGFEYGAGSTQELGMWDCQGDLATETFDAFFETRWLTLGDAEADKDVYRVDVIYVQTGDHSMVVGWAKDWDDRATTATDTFPLADADATVWNEGNWGTGTWDKPRVRIARVDITDAFHIKSIRFKFSTVKGPASRFRIVGIRVHYADHGIRDYGTDLPT